MPHAASSCLFNLRGGIFTVIEADVLVLQESVLLTSATRFFPMIFSVDWKQEWLFLCLSEIVVLSMTEVNTTCWLDLSSVGIAISFPNKDPSQINTPWFFLTTHVKITPLGFEFGDNWKQSALDLTIGKSAQSMLDSRAPASSQ